MSKKTIHLPQSFLDAVRPLLGDEYNDFLKSYQLEPVRALRFSNRRSIPGSIIYEDPVPWADRAFYVSQESQLGAHPLHWAGAYYLQEPSAMAAVSALNPRPGDKVLDLCAAPGGKATQIADCLLGEGLLIANEPFASRAMELNRNIERMGIRNAVVTNNLPEELAQRFPSFFDKILVDAPCSGEGMFRKDPGVLAAWTEELSKAFAKRQLQILQDAAVMLKPGGRLLYSTCTFNRVENEDIIESFFRVNSDFALLSIDLPGIGKAPRSMLRLWPHKVRGEGHFIALMGKKEAQSFNKGEYHSALHFNKKEQVLLNFVNGELSHWITEPINANAIIADTAVVAPSGLPDLTGLRVLRLGLHLCSLVGKTIKPDHALALAVQSRNPVPITYSQAQAYRKGEVLSIDNAVKGYATPALDDWPLGWGKASQGVLKNHYPKGLRKLGDDKESNQHQGK